MGRTKKQQEEPRRKRSITKPELDLASETKRSIVVIIFVLIAGVCALSLLGIAGAFGQFINKFLISIFGIIAYIVPILLGMVSVSLFKQHIDEEAGRHFYFRTYLGIFILAGSIAGILNIFYSFNSDQSSFSLASQGKAGGYLGALFGGPLFSLLGFWGASFVLTLVVVIGVLVTFNIPLSVFMGAKKDEQSKALEADASGVKINSMATEGFIAEKAVDKNKKADAQAHMMDKQTGQGRVSLEGKAGSLEDSSSKMEAIVLEDRRDWKLPPFDLLDDNKTQVDSGNIETNVSIIQKTLHDFGIEVEMGEVNVGPTVTQYTLRPATGVKLSQIAALQNDLALSLAAHSIRMELPIPGKSLVGIEVPNKSTAIVRLREVMQTNDFINNKSKLVLALGRDVSGRAMITDLAKMPHLLIAGATGTGKSVAINSLLVSLLYRNTPQDVKFIVVDPKRVEMTPYNGIPHLLTPVVIDSDKAVNALKWAVSEMDRRYKLLAEAGKRNISEYNEASELQVPYIVILVDELADLMAVAQADVEGAIVRLAQMARAVGIHLVLATQRPSVEIITGLIKANITSRIAFAVASQIDSRTILDSSGAEKLLGNGDMLFTSADFTKPKRIQGAYIAEKEIKKVVDFFKQQAGAVIYNEEILEKQKRPLGIPGHEGGDGAEDDLYDEAKDVVMQAGKASASLLQRRLRVGYARAARLLDILEEKGVIGPGDGAKPREVYGAIPAEEKAEYGIDDDLQNQHQ